MRQALLAVVLWTLALGFHAQAQESAETEDPAAIDANQADTAGDEVEAGLGSVTHMPLPRYVSLKGAEGNARRGPSLDDRIDWVFRHRDMPLRVTAEFGHWRKVEDQDGQGGWIHYGLLSGVRTVVINTAMAEIRLQPDDKAAVSAKAESGVIARLGACVPEWCRVSTGGEKGWLHKADIWGIDRDELRD